jgi:quinolinate synthase
MFRTDPQHLAWVLENLVAGHVVNQVTVQEPKATLAKRALDNMLSVV